MIAHHMALMTLVLYCGYLLLDMLHVECYGNLEVNSMDVGVAFLPLTVCIFLKATNNCACPACRFKCLFGIPVMHVCGHGKTPI